ncbi:hypothetical protein EDC30_10753 [Paucimonas lemoignei]|uniref:Lipoprotein n=1 Tax=Paucimonas lemoignei TaxID=29443 RepID=A0A4R3HST7_PAULE|nr:hypothetical protein [Paucimonas lemoignei]TCS36236.1 hypothetical protein EDC30_10753 [Paucimonas lemoignei]
MTFATRSRQVLALGLCALALQGCKIDTLIPGTVNNGAPNPNTTLAWSEGGAFTPDGRLYVIGGNQPFSYGPNGIIVNGKSYIYEVRKNANGTFANVPVVEGNVGGRTCYFGGLAAVRQMLYATCTNIEELMPASVLYRVDTSKPPGDPRRIASTPLMTPAFQPNGIAVDWQGSLYMANSASFIATMMYGVPNVPAVVKVKIADPLAFRVTESNWLPALLGGYSPNGAAISGNQLYLPSMNVIYRIPILANGSAGLPTIAYQTAKTNLFDAVTVLPNNMLAVPEITNPNPDLVQTAYPGTPPATTLTTQLTLIDATTGRFVAKAPFPSYVRPSSVTVSQGTMFPYGSAVVTDAIGAGGLYLVQK